MRRSGAGRFSPTTPKSSRSRRAKLRLEDAVEVDPNAQVGEFVEQPMESVEFGRIAAQNRQTSHRGKKVREAEREQGCRKPTRTERVSS